MHPAKERIAAVIGQRTQGSGYLLAPRLVLTAAHTANLTSCRVFLEHSGPVLNAHRLPAGAELTVTAERRHARRRS
ncbi:hypothetical protein [Streptomyces sp. NPDC051162]|uniref:hypothetical protein n=1 Tax=Streptomyces sp. NPDC051162 TaxID=3154747 RepID=UPI0034362D61